ncbi:MAG: hypothetical protein ABFS56_35480 [Pseudomonadota bacterium]
MPPELVLHAPLNIAMAEQIDMFLRVLAGTQEVNAIKLSSLIS